MEAVNFDTPRWVYEDQTSRLEFLQTCIVAGYLRSSDMAGGQVFNAAFHRDCVNQYILMELHSDPTASGLSRFARAFDKLESISDVYKVVGTLSKKQVEQVRDFMGSGEYDRTVKRYEKRREGFIDGK